MSDVPAQEREILAARWSDPPGFLGWLKTVDHKRIGRRYIITAFMFFLAAGLMAATMRLQLARPNSHLVGPDLYSQLFSTHGSVMMFLFAVPIMQAMGVLLVPLMVGSRNIAFSRLNAFSYFMFLFGGLTILTAFVLNIGPEAGWF
ncbi:MAG TPA: cbb3-type cytochrome c oxidase subunit I, partial [Steroidobacteraceae bacterium]|nr:cbb3-type cytochrome c oxidase subunit I [Steroidobacteraceae bacterium]